MEQNRIPKPGEIYKHFKGELYQILTVAMHTETNELMVVYQALYGDFKTYVRPLEMFLSEVDHVKYPEVKQKYRFELKVSNEELVKGYSKDISSYSVKTESSLFSENEAPARDKNQVHKDVSEKGYANNALAEDDLSHTTSVEMEVSSLLLRFLDAESYTKKLEILTTNKAHITDRIINDMAVALDCTVDEGPIDKRLQELISCLEAKRRFEDRRFR